MRNRRHLLIALGAAVAAPCTVLAQSKRAPERVGRPMRVGMLTLWPAGISQALEKVFTDALRELSWVESRNIVYDRVYADGDEARLPTLAAELVARAPDLIYARPGAAAQAAYSRTRTIPIVFVGVADPVRAGLAKSLSHPGGNVTGVVNMGWELSGKRMQLLREAIPKLNRVGVLTTTEATTSRGLTLVEQAAGSGVEVVPAMVKTAAELDAAFALLAKSRVQAVLTSHSSLLLSVRKRILMLADRQRVPVVGNRTEFADDGALMSYSSDFANEIRRAAQLVDKVLRGTKPADIPVEQPMTFELVVNMKTAKVLGLTMPPSIMVQATRVIE